MRICFGFNQEACLLQALVFCSFLEMKGWMDGWMDEWMDEWVGEPDRIGSTLKN